VSEAAQRQRPSVANATALAFSQGTGKRNSQTYAFFQVFANWHSRGNSCQFALAEVHGPDLALPGRPVRLSLYRGLHQRSTLQSRPTLFRWPSGSGHCICGGLGCCAGMRRRQTARLVPLSVGHSPSELFFEDDPQRSTNLRWRPLDVLLGFRCSRRVQCH
jgi:hypothetical protein